MPNLGNRIPDNPNGILCSAKMLIAGIRQPELHTMFCETVDCRAPATRTAYYILRNC